MPHYLDAAGFTRLFEDRVKNRGVISEALFLLAKNCARKSAFRDHADREDAISTATITAIRAIDKFKLEHGSTAFSYFTTVIMRAIDKERVKQSENDNTVRLDDFNNHELLARGMKL